MHPDVQEARGPRAVGERLLLVESFGPVQRTQ